MITIQMAGGMLDVKKDQEIALDWTSIRFADGIRDPYTNDIELPKTHNNIAILDCYNLLDSPNQLYGTKIQPAILTVDGTTIECYLQVVSVNSDTITVCMYEKILPSELRDKQLKEIIRDDDNSIWVWSVNTKTAYPNDFRRYDYGSVYNNKYAQYHPIKKLNDVINTISNETGFNFPTTDSDLGLLAQNKYVCPENKRQVLMWSIHRDNQNLVVAGGQHIVNDVEGWDGLTKIGESDTTQIAFNRTCTARINYYVSWGREYTTGLNTFIVSLWKNNQFLTGTTIVTESIGKRNGLITGHLNIPFEENDVIHMTIDSPTTNNPHRKFDLLNVVWDIEYSDYQITKDDYGTELVYCNSHPYIAGWGPDDVVWKNWFDGGTYTFYIYNFDGSRSLSDDIDITLPWRGVSYFGYWCNLSDITIGGLFHSLCWYMGLKLEYSVNGLQFVPNDSSKSINGIITEILPNSDKLGQKNYILYNGEENDDTTPISEIDSIWLEPTVTLHQSEFAKIYRGFLGRGKIYQYKIQYKEDGDVDVDYNDIDGTVLMRYQTQDNIHTHWNLELIPLHPINTMGLENITTSTEVTIETFDDEVKDKDYIYLDGRKYMVVNGNIDLKSKKSTITALLVPTL